MKSPVPALGVETRWKVGHRAPRKAAAGCVGAGEAGRALDPDSGPQPVRNHQALKETRSCEREPAGHREQGQEDPTYQVYQLQSCLRKEAKPPTKDASPSAHRQQPARGQHARRLWDPDDRDIYRSPQLLSFIRGTWRGAGRGGSPAQWLRARLPRRETREAWVRSLGREDPPERNLAARSSVPAWEVPRTEEPSGLQS